jgi:hypothetical protein
VKNKREMEEVSYISKNHRKEQEKGKIEVKLNILKKLTKFRPRPYPYPRNPRCYATG